MNVVTDSSPGLIAILRSALEGLEENAQVAPDDPAALRFRQRILRSVAQLELTRNSLKAPDVVTAEAGVGVPEQLRAEPESVIVLVAHRKRDRGDSAA